MTAAGLRLEAARRTDAAVADGLEQLANGWTAAEVTVCLADAANDVADLLAQADADAADCARCDEPATTPVQDVEQVAWLGSKASVWCSQGCLDADAEEQSYQRQQVTS